MSAGQKAEQALTATTTVPNGAVNVCNNLSEYKITFSNSLFDAAAAAAAVKLLDGETEVEGAVITANGNYTYISGSNKNVAANHWDSVIGGTDNEQEVKSLQHDFKEFERDKILMIKNKYPLKATIIPRYKFKITLFH